jgi:serine/threonine protein kinase
LRNAGGGPARSPNNVLQQAPHYPFLTASAQGQLPQAAPYGMVSRYQADFEEVEFLGEGGFGKVVKAKNKLDGRFYAIKKIKLRPEDNEQKVFREVNALSRLNHQFIVRCVLPFCQSCRVMTDC